MKKLVYVVALAIGMLLQSCATKSGCPTSGRAIGAEKLLMGDKKSKKQAKKAGKYRASKF